MDLAASLDPELSALATAFPANAFSAESLPSLRPTGPPPELPPPPEGVRRQEILVPGEHPVPVRSHLPASGDGPWPALLWIHGGGYIIGSAAMDLPRLDHWVAHIGLAVVAVDYRLAPEVPYPGPLEDCYGALLWLHQHADDLGVDPARIGIGGQNAGGRLAAALALLARDRGEVSVAFQLLDCPMLDDRQVTPSSQLDGLPVWSREASELGWRSYLGDLYGSTDLPPHAAAARATDLTGLPEAFVSVGSVDGFRDEDVDYAVRLNQAGVPTELHVYPGAPHGYSMIADAAVSRRSERDVDDWLARATRGPA